jgi:uncharacterized membrane protein YbhN (UPF0104 family)
MSAPRIPGRTPASRLVAWALAILLTASLLLLLKSLDLRRVIDLIVSSNRGLLALAVLINLTLNTYTRARRRRVLLEAAAPLAGIGLWELTRLLLASYAANNLLPARAGDVLFAVNLRRQGFRVASVIAAQLSEKFVELTSLWLLILPTLVLTELSPAMDDALYLLLAAGGVWGVLFVAFARLGGRSLPRSLRVESAPPETLLRLVHRGERALWVTLASIRRIATAPVALRALLWSFAQDASDVVMVGLVALAVGVHVGPGGWLLAYLAVNLASALPSTPGQIGLLEAGAVFALLGLGVGPNSAMAFALLYHLAHLLPITLLGLPILLRLRSEPKPPEGARLFPSP